jgi:hypothetical protein
VPTANEIYRDAVLRHQIGVRQYTAGLLRRVDKLLQEADADLIAKIRARLARMEGKAIDFTSERWLTLLQEIRGARTASMLEYRKLTRPELNEFATQEAEREISLLASSIPIQYSFAVVASDQLRAITSSRPFQGRLLKDWYRKLEADDQARLARELQLGMVQGEPIDDIARRVIGTRKNNYTDGVLSITRRDAQTIVRTAVNHVSNTAREYVHDANSDVIQARVLTATLDGRTSDICRANDGHGKPTPGNELPEKMLPTIPPNLQLPAHMNERSVWTAYINGVGLVGKRPTVADTRTRAKREVDFRRLAKERGVPIQDVRRAWADATVGRVPAATNYQEFLSRQTAKFQDEVLGKTRGKLFRDGGLSVDKHVDRVGKTLTLKQLAATQPEAFRRAGLDPGEFLE